MVVCSHMRCDTEMQWVAVKEYDSFLMFPGDKKNKNVKFTLNIYTFSMCICIYNMYIICIIYIYIYR